MDIGAYGSEIVLNGFGKPEEVADVHAQIAADFKVRVTFSCESQAGLTKAWPTNCLTF